MTDVAENARRPWQDRWPPEVLLVLAAAAALAILSPLNADSAWYLVGTRRLLHGERLYVDLFDVNPPLIFWVLALPAWIGATFKIADSMVAGGIVALSLALSTITALRVFQLAPPMPRLLRSGILIGFIVAGVAASEGQVAQRDQLAAILLLPYALLAATLPSGARRPLALTVLCGSMAAIGIAFKPFFLPAWLGIELIALLSTRRIRTAFRTEALIVGVFHAVYVVLILVLTPAYMSHVVPLARATYWAYGTNRAALASAPELLVPLTVALGALAARWMPQSRNAMTLSETLGAAALGFIVSYIVQAKNFGYHFIPVNTFATAAFVATAWQMLEALGRRRELPARRRTVAALGVAGCGMIAAWAGWAGLQHLGAVVTLTRNPYQNAVDVMAHEVASAAQGEPIYMLSTSVFPAFPLVNLGDARWPYHYNCFWPIPALYRGPADAELNYKAPQKQKRVEREFFQTVIADLVKTPPKLLLVDRRTQMQAMNGRQFDFIRYLSGSPEFVTLFQRYSLAMQVGKWEIYERRD